MKSKSKHILISLVAIILVGILLVAINGIQNSSPIMSGVISNERFNSFEEMEAVELQEYVLGDQIIIATVHYIESPKGTEYEILWEQNGSEICRDKVSVVGDTQGILEFELKSNKLETGELKAEIYYKEKPIYELKTEVK